MGYLKLNFLDVQHGSACHIFTPNGKVIVVDLGTGDYDCSQTDGKSGPFSPLLYLKNELGITQLDGVIITHPHTDHLDDIENLGALAPKVLCRPRHLEAEDVRAANRSSDKPKIDKYLDFDTRYTEPVATGTSPFDASVNGGVEIGIYGPKGCAKSNLNNQSMAIVVNYASTKILITGDQESAAWNELFKNEKFTFAIKDVDVLLASHHGRESGFSEELYTHMGRNPNITIVSDGPQGGTCVADRYHNRSTGWQVYSRSRNDQKSRYCLTTRNDGTICVECGYNEKGNPILGISTR